MLSKTEYNQLKSVIVGIANNAKVPNMDISLRTVNYADKKDINNIRIGLYPKRVIEEANEDLEIFCDFLRKENIIIYRPINNNPNYYNYCPRDSVLIYDDLILACPQPLRSRQNEYLSMDYIFKKFQNINYIKKDIKRLDNLYNLNCVQNPNILALTEIEPSFDAANILRDNDNLYYLVSNSGNESGYNYLKELLPDKKIYPLRNVYSYMHLDSTITLLKDGLLLINPSRIKSIDQLPEPLKKWDIIKSPELVDIGHYPGYCNSSIWVGMNLFSINPNLVVLEEHQQELRKVLEKYKIDCAMLPMRHSRTLGGCFHCVTLDLERKES
jgi:N-dimethylarginine dimethylaminohydrolase